MTRKLLVVAFILFCLNKINGQKIYEKDPGFLGSLGGDQVPSNGQEYSNDRYIDVPSISLDYNRLPFWYAKNKGPDDSLDDHRSNLLGNYILSKRAPARYGYGKRYDFTEQRQRRNGKRGQLYLNHLARMNRK